MDTVPGRCYDATRGVRSGPPPEYTMNASRLLFTLILIMIVTTSLHAEDLRVKEHPDFLVVFDPPIEAAAEEVARLYPGVVRDLERTVGWTFKLKPSIVLVHRREAFLRMTQNPRIMAFAVPKRALVVVDYSVAGTLPFRLETTLKHELCHLLIYRHIRGVTVPAWLEEGLCQWVSGGIGEIIPEQKRSPLNRATLRGSFIPMDLLTNGFPRDPESFLLAYEQSKSFVAYMAGIAGRKGILEILDLMKNGDETESAIFKVLAVSLETLEEAWHRSLSREMTWFTFLSYHLYEILFALAALITVFGFIKMVLKKRAYMKEETEDKPSPDRPR
jgi:hypothetical protein